MRPSTLPTDRARLLPEGRRWGFGAHSVLPYLTMALEARAAQSDPLDAGIRNPVFRGMEDTLRGLRRRH